MRPTEKIKKLFKNSNIEVGEKLNRKIEADIINTFEKNKNTTSANLQPNVWRIIMKSTITKFAVAAVLLIAAVLSITILNKSATPAYAIEQTIEAYNNIRFLHVKQFKPNESEPLEYWIKSNQDGQVENARCYLPEHVSPEDGAKVFTWTPQKAELWFKRKNSYLIFKSNRIENRMQRLIEQAQPKLVMEKLLENQKAGVVEIIKQQPNEKQEPATVMVTYKNSPKKEIYYINQATNLVTCIESFHVKNSDEIPKDATVVDQLNQLIGIPQSNMTYEQAAVETVRQFFQALVDKDYEKAGLIFSGVSEEKAKEYLGKLNVTAIISIDTPTPYPKCGKYSFRVPCELEITNPNGEKTIWKPFGPFTRCGDDEIHPDRWIIHGGI